MLKLNMTNKIDKMFAFVAEEDGVEGICGVQLPSQTHPGSVEWMPLCGSTMTVMESLKPIARQIAAQTGKPIKLVIFSERQELETIVPNITPAETVIAPTGDNTDANH